ncbi:hypothetical protein EVA_08893 [gut metagenome]|uniref:Uncharacterized protein n=1 Tax=gut metagenome TaxID=749906 RepID=J9GLF0_9ZZZZ
MIALAHIKPILRIDEPFIGPSIKPKTCSILHLDFDLVRLFFFCSSVRG